MLPEDRLPGRLDGKLLPALSEGIRVLSFAYFRKEDEAAAVRAPIANSVIQQFLHGIEWGELDFLLIDFPPGTGDIQLTLSQHASLSGAIMVTTPQDVAVMDVKKAMSLFRQVHVPLIGIVENMSYYQPPIGEKVFLFGCGGGERLAAEYGLPFLGHIPLDAAICESGDRGTSLFRKDTPASPAAEAFMGIAEHVSAHADALKRAHEGVLSSFEVVWKEVDP
jgi:ATP-binding protein involved in chromosome partitioning